MPAYIITPEDILFFRDGRAMETTGGHGARWPEPSVIFDALHAALHRAFPAERKEEFQPWEHVHDWARSSERPYKGDRSQRFGSLATAGPFPALGTTSWLFPRPQDVTDVTTSPEKATQPQDKTWLLQPLTDQSNLSYPSALSNLPAPLKYPLASFAPPTKDELLPWWTKAAIEAYLKGELLPAEHWDYADEELFAREWHTGIAIDPATQTTGHGEAAGKIYAAQYLRLRDGVSLGIHAAMPMKNGQPGKAVERITELFPAQRTLIVGGQQRVCQVEEIKRDNQCVPLSELLPVSPPISGVRVKWLLLSPAVYPAIREDRDKGISAHPGGWLPNWVCPKTGKVLLKAGDTARQPGESRDAWRRRVRQAPFLDCRLVAARIPKPIVLTGWTEAVHLKDTPWQRERGPRPTLLAVPAGAVYYFEADSEEEARKLAGVLNWHGPAVDPSNPSNPSAPSAPTPIRNRRSTLLGEKGFGLGVCGTWQFYPPDPSDRSDSSAQPQPTNP